MGNSGAGDGRKVAEIRKDTHTTFPVKRGDGVVGVGAEIGGVDLTLMG